MPTFRKLGLRDGIPEKRNGNGNVGETEMGEEERGKETMQGNRSLAAPLVCVEQTLFSVSGTGFTFTVSAGTNIAAVTD